MNDCKKKEEKVIITKKLRRNSFASKPLDEAKIACVRKLFNNSDNRHYLSNFLSIKKPKPKEEEDLDDFIFKDEPVKLHSER